MNHLETLTREQLETLPLGVFEPLSVSLSLSLSVSLSLSGSPPWICWRISLDPL